MKYFIDFEATQFSEEIISIGCVREDGETFYSLVAPAKGKMTPFITNLTGITKEMLETALSPDAAFELFYDWAFVPDDIPDFYCWGDNDDAFIQHTFKRMTSRKARMAAGYICGSLIDYHKKFCKSAKIKKCALVKAYNVLLNKEYEQIHNALDDAMMLFEVYRAEKGKNLSKLRDMVEAGKPQEKKKEVQSYYGISMAQGKNNSTTYFTTLSEAAEWYIKHKIGTKDNPHKDRIMGKIKKACDTDGNYGSMRWAYVKYEFENN